MLTLAKAGKRNGYLLEGMGCPGGCVAGAGLDYVQLGIQTGKMAAQILTGEATCADLPYETIENYGLYVNSSALTEMGLTLPDDVAQTAEEVGPTA